MTTCLHRVESAQRGQWILYHVGYLFTDRTKDRQLSTMALVLYNQYLDGEVCLVQRRLGDMRYEYYAVKR